MDVELVEATLAEKAALRRLLELYQYDFTEFTDEDVGADGRFGYGYLDAYLDEAHRHGFLIKAGGHLAGLVLVRRAASVDDDGDVMDMAEFFVMRKYRRRRVGSEAARLAFDRFAGRWEVREMAPNRPAQAFWRRVIGDYTGGRFDERRLDDGRWLVQSFDSSLR
ncbi:MAG: GNAT family N-acetyltransferase [Dehalococcoidia bacterium]|nr:MAG: GNAT family N-acetyltransferase [Dehalococcoidia bacterium]